MTDTAALHAIPGFLFANEGEELLRVAESCRGNVIEIGSFKGKSTAFLAAGCRNSGVGTVLAVDHFRGSPEHKADPDIKADGSTFPTFWRHIKDAGLAGHVIAIAAESHKAAWFCKLRAHLLFIDGDHSAIEDDYTAWIGKIEPGGFVCFHDYENNEFPEVTRFIDAARPTLNFVRRVDSLMVFTKP